MGAARKRRVVRKPEVVPAAEGGPESADAAERAAIGDAEHAGQADASLGSGSAEPQVVEEVGPGAGRELAAESQVGAEAPDAAERAVAARPGRGRWTRAARGRMTAEGQTRVAPEGARAAPAADAPVVEDPVTLRAPGVEEAEQPAVGNPPVVEEPAMVHAETVPAEPPTLAEPAQADTRPVQEGPIAEVVAPLPVPEPPAIPFRDRFWYMQAELKEIQRERVSRRRERMWRRLLGPLLARPPVMGAVAVAVAMLLVILLIEL